MSQEDIIIKEKLRPILENIVLQLVIERPENPVNYMINYLQKLGKFNSNGITQDEKQELERLRKEIKKYRDLEETHEMSLINDKSMSEDEEDEIDDHIENKVISAKARMTRQREAVSAEVFGTYNPKEAFIPKVIKKSDSQIQRIKARVLQSFLFAALDSKDLKIIIDSMEEKIFKAGSKVIEQGDNGDCLFVVESGELDCFKTFIKGDEPKKVKSYSSGDSFGELSLLYNCPRAATVIASTDSICWTVDRSTFNNIVKEAAQKKRQQYENFLKTVEILKAVDSYELSQIADALKSCNYAPNEYIIREGELGDVFYIIVEGNAIVTKTIEPGKPAQQVNEYKQGDYFGELALIRGDPRAANVVATTNLKAISLDRNSFKRLLGPIEDILQRNSAQYTKYIKK